MARNPLGPQDALSGVSLSQPLTPEQTAARAELWRRYLGHAITYAALSAANADPVAALAALDTPPVAPAPEPEPQPRYHMEWDEQRQQYRWYDRLVDG